MVCIVIVRKGFICSERKGNGVFLVVLCILIYLSGGIGLMCLLLYGDLQRRCGLEGQEGDSCSRTYRVVYRLLKGGTRATSEVEEILIFNPKLYVDDLTTILQGRDVILYF